MSNPREVATKLYRNALKNNIRFPKVWDESKCIQTCGAILLSNRTSDGFDLKLSLEELISKYGVDNNNNNNIASMKEEEENDDNDINLRTTDVSTTATTNDTHPSTQTNTSTTTTSVKTTKKRKSKDFHDDDDNDDDSKDDKQKSKSKESIIAVDNNDDSNKKVKKSDIVLIEANRVIAEAIKDMGIIYFKNKDNMKGGVFSKAAKAIRECETLIKNAKEAMKLKGVGKGVAGYIEEMLTTGKINKLEELRAGTA